MKLIAIIVTYLPDQKELLRNIRSCIDDVEELIIWENTPIDTINYDKKLFLKEFSGKISFSGLGMNVGIGKALNFGAKVAIRKGFTHLLTLDQDSFFETNHLEKYKKQISEFDDHKAGIFGVNYINNNQNAWKISEKYLQKPDCITSGSIVPVKTFLSAGFFDEDLFIDGVDFDFCYKINQNNDLKTIICSEVIMNHQVGYLTKTKFGFSTENYSAFRTYYIVKNHLLLWKRYNRLFPASRKIHLIKNYIIYRLIKIVLAEKDKKAKTFAIGRGIYDAFFRSDAAENNISI